MHRSYNVLASDESVIEEIMAQPGELSSSNRGFKSFGVGVDMDGRDRHCQAVESIHSQRTWHDADPHGRLSYGSGDVDKRLGGDDVSPRQSLASRALHPPRM